MRTASLVLQVKGLVQVVIGPLPHGLAGQFHGAMGSYNNEDGVRLYLFHPLQDIHASHPGQAQVQQDQIRASPFCSCFFSHVAPSNSNKGTKRRDLFR